MCFFLLLEMGKAVPVSICPPQLCWFFSLKKKKGEKKKRKKNKRREKSVIALSRRD